MSMIPSEPRSFQEVTRVKSDPITADKPTSVDFKNGINQLHLCLEDVQDDVKLIKAALGLTDGSRPPAGLSSPRKAFFRTVGATITAAIALAAVYRFGVAIWPGIVVFLKAVNAAILAGKL